MNLPEFVTALESATLADLKAIRDAITEEYSARLRIAAQEKAAQEIKALEDKIAILRAGGAVRGRPRKNPVA